MRFRDLRTFGLLELLKRSVRAFSADDMLTYAAALSYSALFALFPFLIFLITLLGFLNISEFFDWILEQAKAALPAESYRLVEDVITQVQGQPRGGLLSISIIVAIWGASSGIRSVMNALNVAYDVEESRPALRRYGLSVVYTLGLAVLLVASAGLMLTGPRGMEWVADQAGMGSLFVTLWTWLRWPVLAVFLLVTAGVIYALAPNHDQSFKLITPGAVLAVILWLVASIGFSFSVSSFANYSATYGSLGGIIVLLLYFYISSVVLLLGAEVNAQVRRIDFGVPIAPEDP